jgi:RHS repeat-associated protein
LRTQKNLNNGDSNIYHYDLNGRRIQHDKNNNRNTSTIYLGWQPVAHIEHESNGDIKTITYLTGDQIGSPRLGTNQTKRVVWNWEADAFGSTEPNQDVDDDGQIINIENRLAGNYSDAESGLQYNWHRYRDAEKGRYLTSDPIGLGGGLNTYGYAYQNATGRVDLDGLRTISSSAQGIGDVLAGGSAAPNYSPVNPGNGVFDPTDFPNSSITNTSDGSLDLPPSIEIIVDIVNAVDKLKDILLNESGEGISPEACDDAVDGITEGATPGDKKGHFDKEGGDAQKDFNGLPGEVGENGQKVLPDGSVAGLHGSTSDGTKGRETLHINRPTGKQNIKVRY